MDLEGGACFAAASRLGRQAGHRQMGRRTFGCGIDHRWAMALRGPGEPHLVVCRGQRPLEKDQFECYSWAKEQTGFDPMQVPTATSPSPTRQAQRSTAGGAVRGGAGGGLLGAVVGAIAGGSKWAKKGAAIGGL